jgi:hypothetical protein
MNVGLLENCSSINIPWKILKSLNKLEKHAVNLNKCKYFATATSLQSIRFIK